MSRRRSTSMHTIQENAQAMQRRYVSSELDVHHFARSAVEDRVSAIVQAITSDHLLCEAFGISGSVRYIFKDFERYT